MALLDVIQYTENQEGIVILRQPQAGMGNYSLGSQLVVQEGQVAIFMKDGVVSEVFKPGKYTLDTNNIPFLKTATAMPFGGNTPFPAVVYFVATRAFPGQGWGTPSPIMFRDSELRMVSVRAHGIYTIKITDPLVFLRTLVGARGIETTFALQNFIRTTIVSYLNEELSKHLESILDLPAKYSKIARSVKKRVAADLSEYGISLPEVVVEAITVPPEVQQAVNRASGVAAQDIEAYKVVGTIDALRESATTPGGGAGEGAGLGLGLGAGMAMAQQLSGVLGSNKQQAPQSDVSSRLVALQQLVTDGLITQQDYDDQKSRILASL